MSLEDEMKTRSDIYHILKLTEELELSDLVTAIEIDSRYQEGVAARRSRRRRGESKRPFR